MVHDTFKAPKINKVWELPEGIKLTMVSDDRAERITQLRFVVTSPGKTAEQVLVKPQEEQTNNFLFRNSGEISTTFTIQVLKWIGYNQNDNSAAGAEVKVVFKIKD